MNVITKIGIKDVGPFLKPTVFKVPQGITYIYGKNMLAGGNPNASGKSTLASSIAEIFYDEPIVGTRQDKAKAGSRFVEFTRGKKQVRVSAGFKGKTSKLSITVNGDDKSGRTKSNTKEVLDKLWPITQTDFTTYVYLDSVVPHPLARGTTTERKAFFNEFFGLDKLDAEKKVLQAELSKLKKSRAAFAELKESYESVKGDLLDEATVKDLEEREQKAIKRVARLQAEAEAYQDIAQLVEFKRIASEYLKKLTVTPDDIPTRLKEVKRIIRKAEEFEDELADYRAYKKELARYKEAIADVDMSTPLSELKVKAAEYNKAKGVVEDEGEDEPKKVAKPSPPDLDRKQLTGKQVQLEHAIEHAKKFKKGTCPTCGQDVKAEPLKDTEARLKKVEAQLELLDEYDAQVKKYERYTEARKEWESQQKVVEKARLTMKQNAKAAKLYEKRLSLPSKPEAVEQPKQIEGVEQAKEELKTLEFLAPHVDMIKRLKKADLKQTVSFNPKDLGIAQDELSTVRTKLEVHRSIAARAATTRKRLKELKQELEDEDALKLLLDGYGDKAVKKLVIDAISTHLMNTINQFSSLVFSNYKFEFIWGPQVQLLVHRPKLGTTDVRKLSGAESKLFTLILVLALMRFVPKRKRLNLLILDEPTASFSAETTKIFHSLLPQINQLIPSVLVVTPRASERYEGAHEYTVVRDSGGSYIAKGHPSET
jgi:DNA repair exonuclease SbcCD ATPase subunit